ncbi:MAG: 3-deoxy-manno-octulosonate cytidylyltransferase [Dissulfurispiraceae bacterium]
MSAIVIIPSRYQSTRFPGKPLSLLLDKPMIQHVYERSKAARLITEVFVATDSEAIFDAVRGFGGKVVMTSANHTSGTDRISEAAEIISKDGHSADIIVNVQGDEPMIMPQMIDEVVSLMEDGRAGIGTLVKRIDDAAEIDDPNVVKAVFNAEGFALYFSRSPIPYHRDMFGTATRKSICAEEKPGQKTSERPNIRVSELAMFKHIGIYAYRKDVLTRFSNLPPSGLEKTEKLEQLRALENGIAIKIGETIYETIGVDTPMDLKKVEKCLSISS